MFRAVDVVVVNKIDLLPHLDFDLDAFYANLRRVNPAAATFEVSARTGDGLAPWVDWFAVNSTDPAMRSRWSGRSGLSGTSGTRRAPTW